MKQLKSAFTIIFSRSLGFLMYLILLVIANVLTTQISNILYHHIILFLNANILLFFIIMLCFMISKVFWGLYFPFNLLAPLFSAISSFFFVTFVLKSLLFVELISNFKISWFIVRWSWLIYGAIFLCIILAGYHRIILKLFIGRTPKEKESGRKEDQKEISSKTKEQFKKELKNAGHNVKDAVQDLIQTIKKLIAEQN